MRFFGVFILCISLFFSATSYAASEVDCKNFILRLSPSVEARIDALAAKYEGKVRISFDMELFTEVFAKILHRHFDFEKFWKDLPPVDRLHAWAKLMEAREDYKEMFLMPEMYELWEEKLDLPMSRAEWEKLITPESKAERGKVEWISDLTRADLYIFGKTNAEQAKIKMQMKNDSPVFLKFLDHGPDQKTMEFRIRDDPGLRGFRLPIHLLAALAQLAES
ncbi:MAG: hypothetical protein JWQ35_2152, partial [Bacteriovoracaceae bacterium]|nr:hypothetical protein [Bacteriovoracaceae bacterium]